MKKIYYIYSILACLFAGMLFGCTTDELEKEQPVDFSKLKVVVNATMPAYEGEEEVTTKLTDSGAWQSGDNIYMCVGSEKNSFKLTYRGGGEWDFFDWEGGNRIEAFSEPTGKLTALYCQFGELKRVNGKITGQTIGDIVYTKEGKYRVLDGMIYFDINLNVRPVAKMVIKDVGPKMHPAGKTITGFLYLDGLWDIKWNNQGTTGLTYKQNYPKSGEMTIWGKFPSGPEIALIEIKGKDKVERYTREFNSSRTLNPGEKVTIYDPLGKDANKWKHYDVNGNLIKKVKVLYARSRYPNSPQLVESPDHIDFWRNLPEEYDALEWGQKIYIKVVDDEGKALPFQGTNKVELSFSFHREDAFHPVYEKDYAILYTHKSLSPVDMTVEIPKNYEPKQIKHTFKIDRDNNRIRVFYLRDDWSTELGFFHDMDIPAETVRVNHKGKVVEQDRLSFHDSKGLVEFKKHTTKPNCFIIRRVKKGTTDVRVNVHDSNGKIIAFEIIRLTVK